MFDIQNVANFNNSLGSTFGSVKSSAIGSAKGNTAGSAKGNASSLAIQHPVKDTPIGLIDFALVKVDVDVRDCVVAVTQRMRYGVTGNVKAGGDGRPRVARPIR